MESQARMTPYDGQRFAAIRAVWQEPVAATSCSDPGKCGIFPHHGPVNETAERGESRAAIRTESASENAATMPSDQSFLRRLDPETTDNIFGRRPLP